MASVPPGSAQNQNPNEDRGFNSLLKEYILERDPGYRSLAELREKGWQNPAGDEQFKRQRERADNTTPYSQEAWRFYNMMRGIGDEMQQRTAALTPQIGQFERLQVLDLCMAPGGYSASALKYNPDAVLHGISLPLSQGGHGLLLKHPGLNVVYTDITMLAAEFCTTSIPSTHPDARVFCANRPFLGQSFHLVFCDGQVLRTHPRGAHREPLEAQRLTVSQLILALQRIKAGGTLIMLLHKADTWRNFLLLHMFSLFSAVELFKPVRKHAARSSFYLVAKNVQSASSAAREAVEEWKAAWWRATFGGEDGTGQHEVPEDDDNVRRLLEKFGPQYLDIVKPVFEIQRTALAQKDYVH